MRNYIFLLLGCLVLVSCEHPQDRAVGTLEWDRVELITELSEPIIEILKREGTQLSAGEVILRLDSRRMQARLDEAQAARDVAAAKLKELKRGPRIEKIAEARARLQGAEEALEIHSRDLERFQILLRRKLTSPDTVDAAQRQLDTAQTERNRARASLDELEHGATSEELEQAVAIVEQAEATLRIRQLDLQHTEICAPVAGRLDNLLYQLGEQPPVGKVVALLLAGEAPYARVYLPESLRAQIQVGNHALIYIDGLREPLNGTVRKIQADPVFTPFYALTEHDRGRLTYLTEIILPPTTKNLGAGIPVEARFLFDFISKP